MLGREVSASTHILAHPRAWRSPACGPESFLGLYIQSHLLFITLNKSSVASSFPSPGAGAHVSAHKAEQVAAILPRCARRHSILLCLSAENNHAFALVVCRHQLEDAFAIEIMSNQDQKTRITPLDKSLLSTMTGVCSLISRLRNTLSWGSPGK